MYTYIYIYIYIYNYIYRDGSMGGLITPPLKYCRWFKKKSFHKSNQYIYIYICIYIYIYVYICISIYIYKKRIEK